MKYAGNQSGEVFYAESTDEEDNKGTTEQQVQVWLANSRYRAELTRSKDGVGWVLGQLAKEERDDSFLDVKKNGQSPFRWMMVGNIPLNEWLQTDGLVFTRVEPLATDVRRAISGTRALRVKGPVGSDQATWTLIPHTTTGRPDTDTTPGAMTASSKAR